MTKFIKFDNKCCATCMFRFYEEKYADFVCNCKESENYGDWTYEEDWCEQYKEK